MRIGIDAKWYVRGNPSGKVVVQNIVDELIKVDIDATVFLFFHKRDKALNEKLEQECATKSNIRIVYCLSAPNFLSNLFILPFYAKKLKLDVLMLQNFTPFLFYRKIKYYTYIHDFLFLDFPQFYSWVENRIYPFMKVFLGFAHRVITISESEKVRINRHSGYPLDDISVVYHGISDDFSPQNKFNKIEKDLPSEFILYIGRINVRKNIKLLIDAIEMINDANLVIVGKRDNKSFDIDKYIKKKGLDDRIFLLGHLSYNELLTVIARGKIFVFPSLAEGFGLPPLEAMKSGVPVIVSNVTSLPEVCGDAVYYIDPLKKSQLVDAINRLNIDSSLYNQLVAKGLKHAKKFDWKTSTEDILKILMD
ncbi:glycosyltransferase family 4 protein [Geofilum sp. OHC36d9]|uniref:glycosyltransferase family 4 protein n=1 Tax=Geofilum sp. OHC36d9 TaxID=3458413 RepID=UPI004033C380